MIQSADVAVELGRTPPDLGSPEDQQWSTWIDDALMLVEQRLGDPALLDQTALDYVVRKAVAAHVRRPDDATQIDVSVDDGRVSRRYSTGRGEIEISDRWWQMLDSNLEGFGAFSVRPYGEPDPVCL